MFELWAAEENGLRAYLEKKAGFRYQGNEEEMKSFFFLRAEQDDDDKNPSILKIEGDTATIRIKGVMVSELDFFDRIFGGVTAFSEIIRSVELIQADSNVKNTRLLFDTPGGHFQGVELVWQALMGLRETNQITAVNEGLLASAGFYLASAAHVIESTSPTNLSGSIGVLIAGFDFTESDKQRGIKEVIIVSRNAPDKAIGIETEEGIALLQKRIDTAESFFIDRISQGRKLEPAFIIKNFGRGDVLFSQTLDESPDALSVKMIDKITNQGTAGGDSSASAQSKQENEKMAFKTIEEVLAAHPEVKADLDQKLTAEFNKGKTTGKTEGAEEVQGRMTQAMSYMKEGSTYFENEIIRNVAVKVLKGEESMIVLSTAITTYDMMHEKDNSSEAKKETDKIGDTDPDISKASTDGVVRNEEDMKAAIERSKSF